MPDPSIHPAARVGLNVRFGHGCVVEEGVVIGDGCIIGHHAVLRRGTRLGANVQVGDHSILGQQPMRAANSAVTTDASHDGPLVGDRVRIGSGSVVYAGCELADDVFVADLATVRENVRIGRKTIVGRGVAVENHCTVGEFCKLETNAYITAYSTLGNRVFVAPGVVTSNDNFIGRTEERFKHFKGVVAEDGARLGVGCVILPGRRIGADAVIAAGAVLTQDAEPGTVYKGVPARAAGPVPEEQLLKNQS
ncbi:MAG: DapH/DapD/GlmU-related protein [Bacteroidetes bacterium]|nr:DapH/DapD/GlmU-related protein [Bacteroidota bacterium]MDA0875369.1 DapH/DapD/GlmU-related protein [Bacteroidota bacterium]